MDIAATHLDFLVEGYTMQLFLQQVLPRVLPEQVEFEVFDLGSKSEFLKKLPKRLAGYSTWLPSTHRVILVIDCDDDDCSRLREELVDTIRRSTLGVASLSSRTDGQVLPRIVVEMLEAWYFGDPKALEMAYGRPCANLSSKRGLRHCDEIRDPARRLGQLLRCVNKHRAGLKKIELTTDIAPHFDVENNSSPSFQRFRDGVRFLTSQIQE